ncbi:MAG: hypothetical protein BWZ09_01808 [Alphaproteobacteria bacterium ADurb.BinA305]|nr:MAG: hypothetical protein BWZ09_01808 [Alphaproteobacteria bacterium ADurb.BinA305]
MFRTAELETLVQRREDLAAHRRGLFRRLPTLPAQLLQHDDELVATEPGHGIVLAHAAYEDGGDLHEQPIALLVAHGVIDRLEVVQVDEQQGADRALTRAARLRPLQPLHQQPPVGQAGQGVEVGQLPDLGLRRLARGDVARGVEQHRPAVHLERERGHLDGIHASILAPMCRFEGVHFARGEQLADQRTHVGLRMAGIPAPRPHADDLAARSPEHAAEGVAGLDDDALRIGDVDAVAGVLQQDAAALVGTVVGVDQPIQQPGGQPGHAEEKCPQQHGLADVLLPLREVVLLAPADDHEGRQALEPAVGIDARHAVGRARAVEGLRANVGGDDLVELLRPAATADHAGRGIETRPARDQRHVEVAHQGDAMRPELQARKQALEMIGRHGCGHDAREVAIGRVVAAREHHDPRI